MDKFAADQPIGNLDYNFAVVKKNGGALDGVPVDLMTRDPYILNGTYLRGDDIGWNEQNQLEMFTNPGNLQEQMIRNKYL